MMKKLYDKDIREALIKKISKFNVNKIVEELYIHNGNAIADVVTITTKNIHCYEIKSDVDNVKRIIKQGEFFNLSFNKITLVTTQKHIENALKFAPKYWGIILVNLKENDITLKYVRKNSYNKYFDKEAALKILWKEELLKLVSIKKNLRKELIIKYISDNNSRNKVLTMLTKSLEERFKDN